MKRWLLLLALTLALAACRPATRFDERLAQEFPMMLSSTMSENWQVEVHAELKTNNNTTFPVLVAEFQAEDDVILESMRLHYAVERVPGGAPLTEAQRTALNVLTQSVISGAGGGPEQTYRDRAGNLPEVVRMEVPLANVEMTPEDVIVYGVMVMIESENGPSGAGTGSYFGFDGQQGYALDVILP